MAIDKIESFKNQKQEIIDDLKVCISYTPNRENDLLCLMEQYLKAEEKNRRKILREIERCINGEKYENPFLAYNHYDEKDIRKLDNILDEFIDKVRVISKISNDLDQKVEEILVDTIFKINELHDKCYGELVDSWRSIRLIELIASSAKGVGYENAIDIINKKRLW